MKRKLRSDIAIFFFFAKPIQQSCLQFTAGSWTRGIDFSISAVGDNFVFWPSQRVQWLSSAQSTLHLHEVKYAIKWYKSTD